MAVFCPNCGNAVEDGMSFCNNCGAGIGAAAPTPPPAAPQATPPPGAAPYYQPAAPQYQYAAATPNTEPLSTGAFIGMFLLMLIPLVNLILLLVWAFGPNANRNRKSFARASLILMIIAIILAVIISLTVGSFVKKATEGESDWLNNIISEATGGAVSGEDVAMGSAVLKMQRNGDLERITSGEMSTDEILQMLETDYDISQEQIQSYLGEDMDFSQLGGMNFNMEDLEGLEGLTGTP